MEPKVKYKGGSSFVKLPPQFTSDGQDVLVASRNYLVSYNAKTGQRLRVYHGASDEIVGFRVHFLKGFEHVTACTVKGEVVTWKIEIGYQISKVNVITNDKPDLDIESIRSFHLVAGSQDEENVRFLMSYNSSFKGEFYIKFAIYSLSKERWDCHLPLKIPNKNCYVDVGASEKPYLAVVQNRKFYFVDLCTSTSYSHVLGKDKFFTSVACHPSEVAVLTGTSIGQVILWNNISNKAPSKGMYHWHTVSVNAITFTTFGTNFYSGGRECVLVKWDPSNPHFKDFLPRLDSTIEHIAVSNENQFIALAIGDNAIKILDSRHETVSIIQHLALGADVPVGLIYDNRTKSLILNSFVGHIQFFLPHELTLLQNMDIVCQNKITEQRYQHLENINVTTFAIDQSGLWLASVEARFDVEYSSELRLKFWLFNTVAQTFELNTCIDVPHERSVSHMLFQPSTTENLKCVTIGSDRKFKIWQLTSADTIYKKGSAWFCAKIGYYRDLPCNSLAFSKDGSLLAVGFGSVVTTWMPETCELKCPLVHPLNHDEVHTIHFGIANQCHLLVTATNSYLSFWNLLSFTMMWTVPLAVNLLVASPTLPYMAVFTLDMKLYIVSPSFPAPVFCQRLEEDIQAATFVPSPIKSDVNLNWYQGFYLYMINSKQELFSFDADEDDVQSLSLFENKPNNLFRSLIPQTRTGNIKKVKAVKHVDDVGYRNKQIEQFLNAPVQTMVPARLMCHSLLKSIIAELR